MTTPPTLCNLPDVVSRIIFNKVGFKSIINLRKVCRDLRNRIDYFKPETHLVSVKIGVDDCKILFQYGRNFGNFGLIYEDDVEYSKAVESGQTIVRCQRSIVRCEYSEKKIVNSDFLELALRDFLLILKFQRKCIQIYFSNRTENSNNFIQFLEMLGSFLAIENQLLKVDKFQIHTNDQKSVISALSLTDPQSIHSIAITGWYGEFQPRIFTEIMEMKHWKTAKRFSSTFQITGVSVQNFRHFSQIDVTFKSISVEEVLEFKKIFQNSTIAHLFEIQYDDSLEDREQFLERLGPAFMFRIYFGWYFRMSTTDDDVLLIQLDDSSNLIIFQREAVANVRKHAVIQN